MKKQYGLSIKTERTEVIIDFNEKAIKKAGYLSVNYCNNIPTVTMGNWTIAGHKRFKKLRRLLNRNIQNGIEISGDCLTIQGKPNSEVIFENTK